MHVGPTVICCVKIHQLTCQSFSCHSECSSLVFYCAGTWQKHFQLGTFVRGFEMLDIFLHLQIQRKTFLWDACSLPCGEWVPLAFADAGHLLVVPEYGGLCCTLSMHNKNRSSQHNQISVLIVSLPLMSDIASHFSICSNDLGLNTSDRSWETQGVSAVLSRASMVHSATTVTFCIFVCLALAAWSKLRSTFCSALGKQQS